MSMINHSNEQIQREISALVCIDRQEYSESVTSQLLDLGVRTEVVTKEFDAQMLLKSKVYDIVIIAENFSGSDLQDNKVLRDLIQIPADQRRFRFFVLIGKSFDTLSEIDAFANSVDMVFNYNDMDEFGAYLQMAADRKQDALLKFQEIGQTEEMT